jgi:hypothetical protein
MWSKQQTLTETSAPSTAQPSASTVTPFTAPTRSPSHAAISASHSFARLGFSLQIKGEITGSEDLQIDGVVEGPISLGGNELPSAPQRNSIRKFAPAKWLSMARSSARSMLGGASKSQKTARSLVTLLARESASKTAPILGAASKSIRRNPKPLPISSFGRAFPMRNLPWASDAR